MNLIRDELKETKLRFENGDLEILLCDTDYWKCKNLGRVSLGRYDGENKVWLVLDETLNEKDLHMAEINLTSGDITLKIPNEVYSIGYFKYIFSHNFKNIQYVNGTNTGLINLIELYSYGKKE